MNGLEEKLKEVTGVIFNNWYALKVALEHGQGGPPLVQREKVNSLLNNVVSMVLLPQNDVYSVSDYLQDYLDDEFDILLEDESQVHVTTEIYQFCQLFRDGSEEGVVSKLEMLPVKESILSCPINVAMRPAVIDSDMSDSDDDDDDDDCDGHVEGNDHSEKMDQDDPDPGWTVVKHKRK